MTLQIDDNTPVIIGVGQVQEDIPTDLTQAIGPVDITAKAVLKALADTGLKDIKKEVDRITSIRTFGDSAPQFACPFGTSKNMPKSISRKAGLFPTTFIYSPVGGDQPQTQAFETAKALREGIASMAVICGGEAIANMKAAIRANTPLDWADDCGVGDLIDSGPFPDGLPLNSEEMQHGLMQPIQFYAMAETALRLKLGLSVEDYQSRLGELLAPLSETASQNPYSIQKQAMTEGEIAIPSDENRMMVEPYTKAMVAKDGVNQGAALIMTTFGKAKALGVSKDKFVFLHGFAKTTEHFYRNDQMFLNHPPLNLR